MSGDLQIEVTGPSYQRAVNVYLNDNGGLLSIVEALVAGGGGLRSLRSSVSNVDLASFSATIFLTTL